MARVSRTKRSVIGINWNLRCRLKIENLEHQVDDLKSYIKQLERKNKKLLLKIT